MQLALLKRPYHRSASFGAAQTAVAQAANTALQLPHSNNGTGVRQPKWCCFAALLYSMVLFNARCGAVITCHTANVLFAS
jgi:hypothetical protein